MKFHIAVEEMRSTVVEVEADNESEAISKVENAYSENEICLDDVNYIDVRIYDFKIYHSEVM